MSPVEQIIGLAVVLLFGVLIGVYSSKRVRTRFPVSFRKIEAINRLKRAVGMAVEDGSRLHVSLGSAQLNDPSNTSAFVGLNVLHRVGQLTSTSDLPPTCSTGSGGLSILGQDTLKATSIETNTRAFYDPDHASMTGATPFSYAIGAMETLNGSDVKGNILVGNFGVEAGLLCEAVEPERLSITGSDSIVAQSIFYAYTKDTLIGEELYALPAYLAASAVHQASLRVEDLFRFGVGVVLVIGALLALAGVL